MENGERTPATGERSPPAGAGSDQPASGAASPSRLATALPGARNVALLYAGFAGTWIILSEQIAASFSASLPELAGFGIAKGLLFVALTSALLYLLLTAMLRRLVRAWEREFDSESRYRALFENGHSVMLLIDPENGAIVDANLAAERYYGWPRAVLRGMRIEQINALPEAAVAAEMAKAASVRRAHFEFTHRRADGSLREVDVFSGVVTMGGRQMLFSVVHDATEHKAALAALVAERARFAALFRLAPVGIAFVGTDGRWLEVNDRLCAMLGYTREELLARTFREVTHPEDLASSNDRIAAMISGHLDGYSMEKRYLRRDGSALWAKLSVTLLQPSPADPISFVGVIEDISHWKTAQAEFAEQAARLQRRNDELERFNAAVVGREVRMIELKREVNELSRRIGLPEPYDLDFAGKAAVDSAP